MVHIKEPLLLIGKSSLCGSRFRISLSVWSLTICPTPYNRRWNVLSASLNKTFPSLWTGCYRDRYVLAVTAAICRCPAVCGLINTITRTWTRGASAACVRAWSWFVLGHWSTWQPVCAVPAGRPAGDKTKGMLLMIHQSFVLLCPIHGKSVRSWCNGSSGRSFMEWTHWVISHSSQCSMAGVAKAVVCVILSVGWCI